MDVYVIRHPEPDIAKGICYGQLDVPLRPGFESALIRAAEMIPKTARLYASPLKRCRIAAEFLAGRQALPLVQDPRLMEMNFGEWEGVPWDELQGPEAQAWMENYVTMPAPGGESFEDLQFRLSMFLDETLAAAETESFSPVLITHAGIIRALYLRWANVSLRRAFSMKIPFAETLHFSV